MSVWFSILTLLFIVSSIVLVLVILVQRPQGGGLAQAFGGASGGGTDTAFGGRTGDVLTYLTMGAFAFYLVVAIGLNVADDQTLSTEPATEEQVIEPGLLPTDGVTPKPAAQDAPTGPTTEASDAPLVAPAAPAEPAPQTPAPAAPPASSEGVPAGAPAVDIPVVVPPVAASEVPPADAPAGKP